jgi:hypothetical protein
MRRICAARSSWSISGPSHASIGVAPCYLRAWQGKYQQSGLVIIGIHTPEFSFEHDVPSVQRQARAMKIDYPIAIDSNYSIWSVSVDSATRHHRRATI